MAAPMLSPKRMATIAFVDAAAVVPGLITLYTVHAGQRTFSFSSFFQRHKELVALLRERAELH